MSKKHFIALANKIRDHNRTAQTRFTDSQISALADFCANQNHRFNRPRWISYINGECGPNGGSSCKGGQ